MNTRKTGDLPARLEGVRRRFERWRRIRKGHARIPDALWAAAVKMAATHGISRTAKTLRVACYALKKQVGRAAVTVPDVPEGGAVATFLELAPPASVGSGECTVEWEDTAGAKMRVHLKGVQTPDLAALSRSFWNPGP